MRNHLLPRLPRYKLFHWLFRWTTDTEGDITLTVAGFINFTKYKEHTVIRFGRNWEDASRYFGINRIVY